MKLIEVGRALATDEQCLAYLEHRRWPNGVRCIVCGSDKISRITRESKSKNKRAQLYQCLEPTCKQQFSATTGTIFHDSHLPLHKWFTAVALLVDAKKGMSALQLSRHLNCNYRTAWYLSHRIREAMTEADGLKLTGTVEIDETYIGGKQPSNWRKLRSKDIVMGIRERGGDLRLIHIENATAKDLGEQIQRHVAPDAKRVITDELPAYIPAFISAGIKGDQHKTIRHRDKIYVQGDVHTNTVESSFSLFKRAVVGSYHKLSIKHLQRYLNEFSYRFNRREDADLFEQTVSRMASVKQMPYAKLVEENAFTPFVRH
jgi:ISXO2-like transposase domain/Transposase zinc-ribbon domain